MKRIVLVFVFPCFFINVSNSATITWDGEGGDGLWSTAMNWVGDIIPGAADDVLLDNSVLAGNYTVTLPGGTASIVLNSLTVTPSGLNTILVTVPVSNTSSSALQINGAGDAFVLNAGATFRNSSGAGSGTPVSVTATNFFRINNGGKYIHNTPRGHTNNLAARLSTAAGTEFGEFEFDVPAASFTVSLSGRTYGILTFSSVANGGNVTYLGSGANALTVNGSLNINTGVNLSISMSGDFIVKGNYYQSATSTFNIQSSANNNFIKLQGDLTCHGAITESDAGLPTIELNGSVNQHINVTGTIMNSITFKMNNPAGATLTNALTLPYHLLFSAGSIKTTSSALLTMMAGSTCSGSSVASFVDGPMRKIGDTDFTFPAGTGGIYAPIGISGGTGSAITDEFTAQYFRVNPQDIYGNSYGSSGIDHVSFVEYWTLERVGNAAKRVSLDVHPTSFCTAESTTFVSQFDGAFWTNETSTGSVFTTCNPPYRCGTLTTNNPISNFTLTPSVFSLATTDPFAINPLPIKLIDFKAEKISGTISRINWELSDFCSGNVKFELEKSTDNRNFNLLASLNGSDSNRFYAFNDARLSKGTTWYRLKMIDVDGTIQYSKVVAIFNEENGFVITSLAPNPVRDQATITFSTAKKSLVNFKIYDVSGNIVKQWQSTVSEGNNTVHMNVVELARGIYHILASAADARATYRFMRQ